MFSIHNEFPKLDVAEDKNGHQAVAPPETPARRKAECPAACRLDREFTERAAE